MRLRTPPDDLLPRSHGEVELRVSRNAAGDRDDLAHRRLTAIPPVHDADSIAVMKHGRARHGDAVEQDRASVQAGLQHVALNVEQVSGLGRNCEARQR